MLFRKRIPIFEFQDFPWFPDRIRDGITDYLHFLISTFRIYDPIFPLLEMLAKRSQDLRIVDLCAGGGGASVAFLSRTKTGFKVFLTDLYPNLERWGKHQRRFSTIIPVEVPTDATNCELVGMRTLFTSFHHFSDESARKILANAHDRGQPIAIFEFTQRDWRTFLLCLPSPVIMFFLLPFSKPRLSTLFYTYVIPLVPLAVGWDILASVLRSRTREELMTLTKGLENFDWKIEEFPSSLGLRITAFYGVKKA